MPRHHHDVRCDVGLAPDSARTSQCIVLAAEVRRNVVSHPLKHGRTGHSRESSCVLLWQGTSET
eukprot:6205912-Prymnesium_polylepis.1